MAYSNQKTITIKKAVANADNLYTVINIEALRKAMNVLRGEVFKLWMYLAKNQDGYTFDLSQKDCSRFGIKRSSYDSAVAKLIDLGYLKQTAPFRYVFVENPL